MTDYQRAADRIARRNNVPPWLFRSLVGAESNWNQGARSPVGAVGFTQLMPATARGLGVNPDDPLDNLRGGARYLRQQLDRFGGDLRKAVAAYNAGPGAVEKYGGVPPFAETQAYVRKVLGGRAGSVGGGRSGGGGQQALLGAQGAAGAQALPQGSAGLLPLLQALSGQQGGSQVPSGGLQSPSFAAAPPLPAGAQSLASGGGPAPRPSIEALLSAVQTQGGDVSPAAGVPGMAAPPQIPAGAIRGGVKKFEGTQVAGWIDPILEYARAHGWKGSVTSGFRTRAQQEAIYNSGVRPAARPGTSNHEGTEYPRGAVDVSQAQQLAEILRRSPYRRRLVWAGGKDPVHFSHPHGGSY